MEPPTFAWTETVDVRATAGSEHIENLEIAGWLGEAGINYLTKGLAQEPDVLFSGTGRPIVREITVRFDREVFGGERLTVGVRMLSRGRRSFVVEQTLLKADGTTAAVGRTVMVTIDTSTGRAVEIPGDFWAAVEAAADRATHAG